MTSPQLLQMVRVCREFQRYTGNDEPILYNIDSDCAPKFHIHPTLLASEFFQRRTQFYGKLKKVVTAIEDEDELLEYIEDEEVSFMLHHFGIQTVITKVNEYKEKSTAIADIKTIDHNKDGSVSTSSFHKERLRVRKSFMEKLKHHPLLDILWCFLRVRSLQKTRNKSRNSIYNMCIAMIQFGIKAQQHCHKLLNMMRELSTSQLQKKLKYVKYKSHDFYCVDNKQMILMCNDMRSWTKNGIKGINEIAHQYKQKAMELTAEHFFSYYDCKLCHCLHNDGADNKGVALFNRYKGCCFLANTYDCGKTFGVVKICICNDLISRITEMNRLSMRCLAEDEEFIALKLLRCSWKLSKGYIEDDFLDEDEHLEHIENLSDIWWEATCDYCMEKAKDNKHKACSGCMKVVYCCRRCQKMDWNEEHRYSCDKSWNSIYNALKITIFNRM